MKYAYGPFWADLTGHCYATSVVVFDDIFINEPNNVFDHNCLSKFNFSDYVRAFTFGTPKTGGTLVVNRP
jgi:hypothetical protein